MFFLPVYIKKSSGITQLIIGFS